MTEAIEVGTSNVYSELGYSDAAGMQRKATLVAVIGRALEVIRLASDASET